MRPVRILQLINVPWWNACAYYAVSLSEGLARRGHAVIVAGMKNSPAMERAKGLGLRTEDSLHLTGFNPVLLGRSLKRLRQLLDRERIDLINAHRAEGHVFGALASRQAGRPVPVVRTRGDVRPPKNNLFNRILHQQWTERIIIPGDFMRANGFFPFSLSSEKVVTIPSGVDVRSFHPSWKGAPLRRKLNIDEKISMVGIVARLSPGKGHRTFLQAAARVLRSHPETSFLVSGEEVEVKVEELRNLARNLGIEKKVI
ncbi:MAG: glycosyltransferase, partial [bacterium]